MGKNDFPDTDYPFLKDLSEDEKHIRDNTVVHFSEVPSRNHTHDGPVQMRGSVSEVAVRKWGYVPVWKRCIMCDGKGEFRRFEPLPAPDDPDAKDTNVIAIHCYKCDGEGYLPTKDLFIKITY